MNEDDNKKKEKEISALDIFGSIPKPDDLNPFEGLDLDNMCVHPGKPASPVLPEEPEPEGEELFELNPIEGIDLQDISWAGEKQHERGHDAGEISEVNPLHGIDVAALSAQPSRREERTPPLRRSPAGTAVRATPPRPSSQASFVPVTPGGRGFSSSRPPSGPPPQPPPAGRPFSNGEEEFNAAALGVLATAYNYAEINRIRERIVGDLLKKNQHVVMFTSPTDDTGNTFLAAALGCNGAYNGRSVLLLDMNMRHPKFHEYFGLEQKGGVIEIARGELSWREAVKLAPVPRLAVISAGLAGKEQVGSKFHRSFLEGLLGELKKSYDLIIVDSSPVLVQNRNNVDTVLLSVICDYVVLLAQDARTTKANLRMAVSRLTESGGKINGILYNQRFRRKISVNRVRDLPDLIKDKLHGIRHRPTPVRS